MSPAAVADRAWCVVVPHHARGARLARYRLAGELSGEVTSELLADAVAVVAELVGNAIRHAHALPGDVIRVAWRIRTGAERQWLEVRVTDGGAGDGPRQRDVGPDSLDGRGLAIVSALADEWGVERDGLGQSVWARLTHLQQVEPPRDPTAPPKPSRDPTAPPKPSRDPTAPPKTAPEADSLSSENSHSLPG